MTLTVRAVRGYALARPNSGATIRSVNAYALVNNNPLTPGTPVAPDFKSDQIDLLYKLIENSNPGFTAKFPKGSVSFGVPAAVALVPNDPYLTDTSIMVAPAPGSTSIGNQTVRYRRIEMRSLFGGMVVNLVDYVSSGIFLVGAWKAALRLRYGLNIPDADITNGGSLTTSSPTVVVAIAATSQCYKGQFTLTWIPGGPQLSSIITDANRALAARLYPGGNDFSVGRKPTGEFLTFCQNASNLASTLEGFTSGTAPTSTDPLVSSLVNWLNSVTRRQDWNIGPHTATGGLTGINWFRYALPNAAIPEGNSAKFNRCVVIQGTASSWFSGKIIIHYNV